MKQIYILLIFTLSTMPTFCTDYFWVNNSGNWSDHNNHWATSSGGSVFHSSAPSSSDNVIFDQNSFSFSTDVLVIDIDANCNSFIFNNNLTPEISSTNDLIRLRISGDLTLNYPFDFSYNGELIFNGISNIRSSSNALHSRIKFNSPGGSFTLIDDFNSTDSVKFVAGDFYTQSNICRFNFIEDDDYGTRNLYFGNSDVFVTGGMNGYNSHPQEHFFADSSRFVFNNGSYLNVYSKSFNVIEINPPGFSVFVGAGNIDSLILRSDCHVTCWAGSANHIALEGDFSDSITIMLDGYTVDKIDGRSDSSDFVQLQYGDGQVTINEVFSSANLKMIRNSQFYCFVDIERAVCMKDAKFAGFSFREYLQLSIQSMEIFGNGEYTSMFCDSLTLHPNTTHSFDPQEKQTFNNLFATGSSSQNIILRSTISGVQDTIEMNHDFCGDYLDISDMLVYGPNNYYAGANSINTSNNTGWNFTFCVAAANDLTENKNLMLYPIPASDRIYFNEPVDEIKIFDLAGKLVFISLVKQITYISLSSLSGNFFTVELANINGVVRRKLILK